jgi:alkylation response protein AidB-like acyl-CoA dehydrogenase
MATNADVLTERARDLVPVLRGRAQQANEMRRIQDETFKDFWDAGLLGVLKPQKFGGAELRYDAFADLAGELGRGDGSAAWIYAVLNVHDHLIALYPEQAQKELWADPRMICASSFLPGGKATPDKNGWRLSGKWSFCSGVDAADWMLLGAIFGMVGDPPHPDVRFTLVPIADCAIVDDWHVIGLRGTGSKSVTVNNAFVPEHRVLGFDAFASGQTPGGKLHPNPLYSAPQWAVFPFTIASPAAGIARGAFETYVDQVKARANAFGEAMSSFRSIQMRVAEAGALIDAADLLYKRSCRETIDKIMSKTPLTLEHRVRSRRDQAYSVEMARRATELLFKSLGGKGLYEGDPVQRAFRDMQGVSMHIATVWDVASALYGQVTLGGKPTEMIF